MRVSIIVPVYQVEEYIEKCISSLVTQTHDDIEIILVDDGTKDNSGIICDMWAKKDRRITVYHKENGGLSDARNYGLAHATGEYILFVDSDDYIDPDACEKLLAAAHIVAADIVAGDAIAEEKGKADTQLVNVKSNDDYYSGYDFLKERLKINCSFAMVWLYMYRRQFLIENALVFKCSIYHEDELFTPQALLAAQRIVVVDFPFYHYVIRPGSTMTAIGKNKKHATDMLNVIDDLAMRYVSVADLELRKYLYDYLCKRYLHSFCAFDMLHDKTHKARKKQTIERAYTFRNKLKSLLFCVSPAIYVKIHSLLGE